MENDVSLRVHNSAFLPCPGTSMQFTPSKPIEYPFYYYPSIYTSVFQVVSFLQFSPTKILYAPLLATIRATCPTHVILLEVSPSIFLHMSFNITLPSDAKQCQLLKTSFDTPKNYPLKVKSGGVKKTVEPAVTIAGLRVRSQNLLNMNQCEPTGSATFGFKSSHSSNVITTLEG